MQEVTIRIRFNRECLGFARASTNRGGVIYRMPRDGQDRVMFLQSWWKGRFRYAAKVVNRCHNLVQRIAWDPIVDGAVSEWKRDVPPKKKSQAKNGRRCYALHEAFMPGDVIGVNAVLPEGMSLDDFTELLSVVGTYKGISPFQSENETYGTFDVVSVHPAIRARPAAKPETETATKET